MKRSVLIGLALAAILATPALAYTDIHVNIGVAPPAPVVVFHRPPPMVLVPGEDVYVVGEPDLPYDCFRFGAYFYIYNGGWWYRAPRYGGPYRVIETRYVPRPIMMVPDRHWRHPHGMPPGQAKKYYGRGYSRGYERGYHRASERGNDRGRGRGRGHD